MERRTFLKSGVYALSIPTVTTFSILMPKRASADPVTATVAVISFASSVMGMFGSKRAARAAAKAEAAKLKMLQGLVESMDSVLKSQAFLVQKVAELPSVIQEIFKSNQKENDRLAVLVNHYIFLKEQEAMIENQDGRAENPEAVREYIAKRKKELNEVRKISARIQFIPESVYDNTSVVLKALCTRVEIDLASELLALGEPASFVPGLLKDQISWYNTALSKDDESSLTTMVTKVKSELERRQTEMLKGAGQIDTHKTLLHNIENIPYSEDPYPNSPNFFCDGPDDCFVDHVNVSKTAKLYKVSMIQKTHVTQYFSSYDAKVELYTSADMNAPGIGLSGSYHLNRKNYKFPVPNGEQSTFSADVLLSEKSSLYLLGLQLSETSKSAEVASAARELCKHTLRSLEEL